MTLVKWNPIAPRLFNQWPSFFEDEEYREELQSRIERIHGVSTEFMQSQAKISLLYLYFAR